MPLARHQKLFPHFRETGTAVFAVEEVEYGRHDLVCLLCTLMATEPCIASAARMKARLVSFGFGLLFQLQDARS
jgi:hypothetical protein